jgi:uncharacterized alkaline shock family protein YloU
MADAATATTKIADRMEGLVLETDRGITTVADIVVAKIAGLATREVAGVHNMGTTFRRLLGRVRPGESITQGVAVEVGKKETAIDMVVVVDYGYPIPELAQEIRENVIAKVESGTGLIVKEVNIEVDDLFIASDEEPPPTTPRVQ